MRLLGPFGAVQDEVHRRPGAGTKEAAPAVFAALGRWRLYDVGGFEDQRDHRPEVRHNWTHRL